MLNEKQNIRIKYIFLICLLIFFLVLFKVFYIQVIKYNKLNKLANELWSRNLTVSADRGRILDRTGKVIDSNPDEGTRVKSGSTIKILLN